MITKTYRRKPERVEVYIYDPNICEDEGGDFGVKQIEDSDRNISGWILVHLGGEPVKIGDYVVTYEDGRKEAFSPERFKELFEPFKIEDKTCQ